MSTIFTLSGLSFDTNVYGAVVSTPRAAELSIEGSADLAFGFDPASNEPLRVFPYIAAGALEEITLDGSPITLADERYQMLLLPYDRDGTSSTSIMLIDVEALDFEDMSAGTYLFPFAGAPIIDGPRPGRAALEEALFSAVTIPYAAAPLAPGDVVRLSDLPYVTVSGGAAGSPVDGPETPIGPAEPGEPVRVADPDTIPPVPPLPATPTGPLPQVAQTLIGGDGPDRLASDDLPAEIRAGAGDDTLLGRGGDDVLRGGAGNDIAAGGDGADIVLGDAGDDSLGGGAGADILDGGSGADTLGAGLGDDFAGGAGGNDVIALGAGDDTALGGAGDDTAGGSFGDDIIYGGAGDDSLGGGTGRDTLLAGSGDDSVGGGEGDDVIHGLGGNDFLAGGGRNDAIAGGDGDDTINGGAGSDTMQGGAGADVFVWTAFAEGVAETDFVTDFEDGLDRFRMAGVTGEPGAGLQGRLDALNLLDVVNDAGAGVSMTYKDATIIVQGVSVSDLTLDDFVFV